jgi:hypothetical protein
MNLQMRADGKSYPDLLHLVPLPILVVALATGVALALFDMIGFITSVSSSAWTDR